MFEMSRFLAYAFRWEKSASILHRIFFHQNLIWGIKNAELDADFKFVDMGSEKCSQKIVIDKTH
jgi:hypothetical protein